MEYEDGCSFTLSLGIDSFMSYLGLLSLLLRPGCCSWKHLYGRDRWGVDGFGAHSSVVSPQRSFYWKLNLLQRVGSLLLGYPFQQLSALIARRLCHTLAVLWTSRREGDHYDATDWCFHLHAPAFVQSLHLGEGRHLYWRQCDLWSVFFFFCVCVFSSIHWCTLLCVQSHTVRRS